MSKRRYVVAYGDDCFREVAPAPDLEKGDFLTRTEAALRIISEMSAVIERARKTRAKARRVLRAEQSRLVTT